MSTTHSRSCLPSVSSPTWTLDTPDGSVGLPTYSLPLNSSPRSSRLPAHPKKSVASLPVSSFYLLCQNFDIDMPSQTSPTTTRSSRPRPIRSPKVTRTTMKSTTSRPLPLSSNNKASTPNSLSTKAAPVNRTSVSNGETGATSWALVSARAQRPTRPQPSSTPSSGLSLEESLMVPLTPRRRVTTRLARW